VVPRDISYTNKKSQTAPKTEPYALVINIPPLCKHVVTLQCEIYCLKNLCAQEVSEANCPARLSCLDKSLKKLNCPVTLTSLNSLIKVSRTAKLKIPQNDQLYIYIAANKKMSQQNAFIHHRQIVSVCQKASHKWTTAIWYLLKLNSKLTGLKFSTTVNNTFWTS